MNKRDIVGQKYGRLTAIRLVEIKKRATKGYRYIWEFACDCGKKTITERSHVVAGQTTSCGCRLQEINDNAGNIFKTHGMSHSRFWITFRNITIRCNDSTCNRFAIYGGRGIKCLWNSFEEFRDDMYDSYLNHVAKYGERQTSIDRINNDGDYCKENCRWATPIEQARNTRTNRIIQNSGKSKCLSEWAEETGIKAETIAARIRSGWSIDKSLTTVVR